MKSLTEGYILHTNRDWLSLHATNHSGATVFFTRGPSGSLMSLATGGLLVFIKAREQPHVISGVGTFLGNELTTLEHAWSSYGQLVGCIDREAYFEQNKQHVGGDQKVALLHVGNFQKVDPPISLLSIGIESKKNAARGWGLNAVECGIILEKTVGPRVADSELEREFGPSAEEGRRVQRLHLQLERDRSIVAEAKRIWTESKPELPCDVCDFSFIRRYGDRGRGYIEAHHISPLGSLKLGETRITTVKDFSPVCGNCHRMLHRLGGISIDELRQELLR